MAYNVVATAWVIASWQRQRVRRIAESYTETATAVWLAHTCCAGVHNGRLYLTPQQLAAAAADLHTYIAPCLRWYGLPSAYGSCLLLRGSVYADTILVHTRRQAWTETPLCRWRYLRWCYRHFWLTQPAHWLWSSGLIRSACSLAYLCHSVHRSHADNAFRATELRITQWQLYALFFRAYCLHALYLTVVC